MIGAAGPPAAALESVGLVTAGAGADGRMAGVNVISTGVLPLMRSRSRSAVSSRTSTLDVVPFSVITRPETSSAHVPSEGGLPLADLTSTLSDRNTYRAPAGAAEDVSATHTRSMSRSIRMSAVPAAPEPAGCGVVVDAGESPVAAARRESPGGGQQQDARHEACRSEWSAHAHLIRPALVEGSRALEAAPNHRGNNPGCGSLPRQFSTLCVQVTPTPLAGCEGALTDILHCMRRLPCFLLLLSSLSVAVPRRSHPRRRPAATLRCRRVRGDDFPRRRRPGAAHGGDTRRHRVRQAARAGHRTAAGGVQGPRRAEGYRR